MTGSNLKVFGHHAEKAKALEARPAGEEIEVGEEAASTYSRVMARREAMARLGGRPFTRAEAEYLAGAFGDEVTERGDCRGRGGDRGRSHGEGVDGELWR